MRTRADRDGPVPLGGRIRTAIRKAEIGSPGERGLGWYQPMQAMAYTAAQSRVGLAQLLGWREIFRMASKLPPADRRHDLALGGRMTGLDRARDQ